MKKDLFLVLHNIRSAYNVGAIFRTADAVGVKKIYLCGITPVPYLQPTIQKLRLLPNDKITKTALGAERSVPWEYSPQAWRVLSKLRKEGIATAALEQAGESKNLFKYKAKFPLALIVGHERKGLSRKILSWVDDIIEIPMAGKKESLNVSVAAGVALYRLLY